MEAKKFWESKTFWFNVLTLVVLVASEFGLRDFAPDPNVAALATGIVAVINIVLRFMTDKPIIAY